MQNAQSAVSTVASLLLADLCWNVVMHAGLDFAEPRALPQDVSYNRPGRTDIEGSSSSKAVSWDFGSQCCCTTCSMHAAKLRSSLWAHLCQMVGAFM